MFLPLTRVRTMNTLIDVYTVLNAVQSAKSHGVDLSPLAVKACYTESFNECEVKEITTWSLMQNSKRR